MKKLLNRESLIIALGFFVLSFLWILFSDRLLLYFLKDPSTLTSFQTYKGWFYVLVATLYIFYLVNREINKKNRLIYLLNKKNKWQNLLISNIPNIEVLLFDEDPEIILAQGKKLISQATGNDEIALDKILTFSNNRQLISFTGIKKDVLSGNSVNLEFEDQNYSLMIKGRPVFDDQGSIIAGLLVYINNKEHSEILKQLESEKEKYAALFNEYHNVNLELKVSYEKLSKKNDELVESKERYQNFFMQSMDGIYRLDFAKPLDLSLSPEEQKQFILENGFLAKCNPVFAMIYGHNDVNDLLHKKISELHNIQTVNIYFQLAEKLVRNNYRIENIETVEPLTDGENRNYLNTMVGNIENNQLVRIWGTKKNITRLKQYEEELIEAKKVAEKSDQLKSAFLANMSHEIRTPLNGIVGFAELLCFDGITSKQKQKYIRIVKSSNTQLLRIIDDILDTSKIETGQLSITRKEFHINKLMHEVGIHLEKEVEKRGKSVTTKCLTQLSDTKDLIVTDRQRVYQILTNLINNSVKFTENGKIEFGYTLKNSSMLEFFVQDTGIGIPKDMQESIFNQFMQVEDYHTKIYGGTGLGLAICKGIVVLLGGEIYVESEPRKGSIFKFTLPFTENKN